MRMKERVSKIIEVFGQVYPDAVCTLDYENAFELLLATQLAAQCTDERVNIVTKSLFKKYKSPEDYLKVSISELEKDIHSTGFYRNKAKNIKLTCEILLREFGGVVPSNMEDLLKLPGTGRKTANVVLGSVFGIPGVVVDTHATRLSNRIGLTKNSDPVKIEKDLMKILPKKEWTRFCHQLVAHGRRICNARKPLCGSCEISHLCNFASKISEREENK